MFSAWLAARISSEGVERTRWMRIVPRVAESVDMEVVIGLMEESVRGLSGVVLAERGDLYNLERWRVESILGREFKYPESRGERRAVELAHHASLRSPEGGPEADG